MLSRRAAVGALLSPLTGTLSGRALAGGLVVAVCDSPTVEKWLSRIGVVSQRRTGLGLGAEPITGVKLLILPLESVNTPGAVKNVRAFINGGGKVAAFYWGAMRPPGSSAAPIYDLCPYLGVRPIGWRDASAELLVLNESGAGAYPFTGSKVSLPRCMTTVVEPIGARTLARFGDDQYPEPRSGVVFQRGNVVYCGMNLTRGAGERAEARELFFWVLQRAAPEFGASWQARDRLNSATWMHSELQSMPGAETLRSEADSVAAALAEARMLLVKGQAARSVVASDKARTLADQLVNRLKAARQAEVQTGG